MPFTMEGNRRYEKGWQRAATLMRAVRACDTMLFEHAGRWWMLTNLDRDGAGDYCRELHVFHAESPLAGHWTPLPGNPVVAGASRARNAGLLRRDGKLYRLAQAQGFDRYGRAIRIFEITALSPREYREELRGGLEPAGADPAAGFHHLSECGGTVVFDAVCPRWLWLGALARGTPLALPRPPAAAQPG